ncbi:hypothetical protein [Pseudonocardia sp. HH130630-07]|uniref:hypothetical protein n=1 Tax=Pseudonocardia sp. HH130630-07 TaxID=1690815 RepID=UPI000814EAC1|nr:hypothetical protein [Pseudonocardia sp. HH130630-07]ANY06184.1 hypothetical protein AFB00_07595 [Pseudonocardia sp. HH130630-07]
MDRTDRPAAGGDGARLRPVRRRDALHRSLYSLTRADPDGTRRTYTVQVDLGREDGHAELYVDGRRAATAEMPASFPVPGGRIEVAISLYGVTRMHLVGPDGTQTRLTAERGTLEDLRHELHRRRPGLSRVIAGLAAVILAVNLVLAVPQALEILTTRVDRIGELVGTFTSPVLLPAWLNTTMLLAGVLAAVERALMLRRNRVLDAETLWTSL